MRKKSVVKLVVAALCLALCLVLPFITGQIREIGNMLCPMHLPVLLCGFLCGWPYGLAIGFIAPLLRSVLFGMPPLFPTALAMAFELAGYGFFFRFPFCPRKAGHGAALRGAGGGDACGPCRMGPRPACAAGPVGKHFYAGNVRHGSVFIGSSGHPAQLVLVPLLVTAVRKAKVMA